MKISTEFVEQFFIMTNPLFWVFALITYIYTGFKNLFTEIGITDWWYILFKLDKQDDKHKKIIKELYKKHMEQKTKMFWLKRKAWKYANKL